MTLDDDLPMYRLAIAQANFLMYLPIEFSAVQTLVAFLRWCMLTRHAHGALVFAEIGSAIILSVFLASG